MDQYASLLGSSKTTVFNYEKDKRAPDVHYIVKVLGLHPSINPTWLVLGEGSMERGADQPPASVPKSVNLSLLETVIVAVEEHLASTKGQLPPTKKARLISIVYDMYANKEDKKVDKAVVINLFELAA